MGEVGGVSDVGGVAVYSVMVRAACCGVSVFRGHVML